MPKPKLEFLHRHLSRHGKVTYYIKLRRVSAGGASASADNIAAKNSCPRTMRRCAAPITPPAPIGKDGKGSVGWLIGLCRHSRDWGELLWQRHGNNAGRSSGRSRRLRAICRPRPLPGKRSRKGCRPARQTKPTFRETRWPVQMGR